MKLREGSELKNFGRRRRIIVIMVIVGIIVILVTIVLMGNICNSGTHCNNENNANSNNTCSHCNDSEVWDSEASRFTDELPPLGLVRTWEPLGATLLFHAALSREPVLSLTHWSSLFGYLAFLGLGFRDYLLANSRGNHPKRTRHISKFGCA